MADVDIQVQKQVAAVFMLPDPARQTVALGAGEPVLQEGAYAIEHIEVESAVLIPPQNAVLNVKTIITLNRSHLAHEIDLRERAAMLEEVWNRRNEFPEEIAARLEQHEAAVRSAHVDSSTQRLVAEIQKLVFERSTDLSIVYSPRGDVLVKLSEALNYQVPKPLLIVDEVDPEDVELKKRTVKDWKRWATARGPASAKFKQQVRKAYRSTCLICGAYFPNTPYNSTPGVDAAHIMPWNEYELDEVFNGLCLCKLHHWAFDEAIVMIRYDNGRYVSEIPNEAENEIQEYDSDFSLDLLKEPLGAIPPERLPSERRLWPHPALLEMLAGVY
ncbi:MAG: HNH endonuclease [Acidobacteriota bacterium]